MANITAQLVSSSIQGVDLVTGSYRVNFSIPAIAAQAVELYYFPYYRVNITPTAVTFPLTMVFDLLYIRNLDATAIVTVGLTPHGGVSANHILNPGAAFIYWQSYSTVPGQGGYDAVVLSTSGSPSSVSYVELAFGQ